MVVDDHPSSTPDTVKALWAPWRMDYIGGPKPEGCALCNALSDDHLVVHRGDAAFVIMNLYPYNNGHVMVAPVAHTGDYYALPSEVIVEMHDLARRAVRALNQTEHPDGFNIGLNLGRAAGAGIADHVHQHVVPRWSGDTNFMPVVAGHKTIGEAIDVTLARLREVF